MKQNTFNPFSPIPPFLYPLKNLSVFWCFQGVEKGCIGNRWVKSSAELSNVKVYFPMSFLSLFICIIETISPLFLLNWNSKERLWNFKSYCNVLTISLYVNRRKNNLDCLWQWQPPTVIFKIALIVITETYLEPSRTSTMEFFAKIIDGL